MLQDDVGNSLVPSIVTFSEEGILAGLLAQMNAHKYKDETIFEVKRLIGQMYSDPKVQKDINRFPYKVVDEYGYPKIAIKSDSYYPEEISAHILTKIADMAEKHLTTKVTEAVITVPAYFGGAQREATMDAARIAGFEIVDIINEPTAAALGFQFRDKKRFSRNLLIFDFGGGTFDVSIVNIKDTQCDVLATAGDCHLGGMDIDMNLVKLIIDDIAFKYDVVLTNKDWKVLKRIKSFCEGAKKLLSSALKYQIDLTDVLPCIDYTYTLTRYQFEKINDGIFKRTLEVMESCILESGLTKKEIDEVVLVGGSTRIPKIQEMLRTYFGKDIDDSTNPDHMVAFGAAIYAAILAGNGIDMSFNDVISLSLGTDIRGDMFSKIVEKNTRIPCEKVRKYQTSADRQSEMSFKIYQGEKQRASENFLLGEFLMTNLKRAPAGRVAVEVKFLVSREGILKIKAKEVDRENKNELDIDMKRVRLSRDDTMRRQEESQLKHEECAAKRARFREFCEDLTKKVESMDGANITKIKSKINKASLRVQNLEDDVIDNIALIRSNLIDAILNIFVEL